MSCLAVIPVVLVLASAALFAFLRRRHPHQWAVSKAIFTPPVNRKVEASLDDDDINRILHGFTTVYWVCDCGKSKMTSYMGDQRSGFPIEAG